MADKPVIKQFNYTKQDLVAEYRTNYKFKDFPFPDLKPEKTFVRTLFFVKEIDYEKNEVVYDVLFEHAENGVTGFEHLTGSSIGRRTYIKLNGKKFLDGSNLKEYVLPFLPHEYNRGQYEDVLDYYVVGKPLDDYYTEKWYAYDEIRVKNDIFGDSQVNIDINLDGTFLTRRAGVRNIYLKCKAKTTLKLPRIDRTSYISNLEHNYFDDEISFNINKRHDSFTDKVYYKVEDSELIEVPYDQSGKISFKLDQRLMSRFPNKDNANVYFQIVTYTKDGERLHSDKPLQKEVIQINPNVKPTLAEFRIQNTNNKVFDLLGANKYLQGISGVRCELLGEKATSGASIVKREITVDKITKSGDIAYFDPLDRVGRIFCTAYVEDSRGRKETFGATIDFESYYLPQIQSFLCVRQAGSAGNNVNALVGAKANELIKNNVNVNSWNLTIEYATRRSNDWAKCYQATVNVENFNDTVFLGDFFSLTTGYDFRLTIADKFYEQSSVVSISTVSSTMVLAKNSVGVGKSPLEYRALDVEGITNSSGGFAIDDVPIQNWQLTKNDGLALRTETDCDLIVKSGFYYVYPAVNSPEGRAVYLIVIEGKKGFFVQIAIDQRSRKMYTRTKWTGIAWQKWVECGGGGDGQLFKLTQDNGYAKIPNVSSWNEVVESGFYYGEGLEDVCALYVGRMHCLVSSPREGLVFQIASDATNNNFGVRTQDRGTWTDWKVLGNARSRAYSPNADELRIRALENKIAVLESKIDTLLNYRGG